MGTVDLDCPSLDDRRGTKGGLGLRTPLGGVSGRRVSVGGRRVQVMVQGCPNTGVESYSRGAGPQKGHRNTQKKTREVVKV